MFRQPSEKAKMKRGNENNEKLDGMRVMAGRAIMSLFSYRTLRKTLRRGPVLVSSSTKMETQLNHGGD